MNTSHSDVDTQAASNASIFDPFPEPRTYPSGWDLSGLTSGSSAVKSESDSSQNA